MILFKKSVSHTGDDNQFTVKGLQEGKEYEFRVAATNKAGAGKWSQTEQAIEARAPDCAPKALGFYGSIKEINIKSGETLKISIPFQASPKPDITWLKVHNYKRYEFN
jgi:titin